MSDYSNLIVGIGGLILAVLTYFAGVARGKRYRQEDRQQQEEREKNARIQGVVDEYYRIYRSNYSGGIHGFLLAGAKTLGSGQELAKAIEQITARVGKSPLSHNFHDRETLKRYIDELDFDRVRVKNEREVLSRLGIQT